MSLQDTAYIAQVVAALGAAIAAIASCRVAFVAHRAADATRATSKGQLVLQLLTEYATPDMHKAVEALSIWVRLSTTRKADDTLGDAEKLHPSRRLFSQYCQKVHRLRLLGLIDDEVVRSAVPRDVAEVYLGIEPLEKSLRADFDQASFRYYEALHSFPPRRSETSASRTR